jgi:exonuclease SbcC
MIQTVDAIRITDFRSLRGTVTIPMSAQIILIHGPNGSGKTSVLSALELAMTGAIPALRRDDGDYVKHLVHEGAKSASIKLLLSSPQIGPYPRGAIDIKGGKISGTPLLTPADAQIYAERCYLAQSVLGRLLDIYQHADPQRESALTRFVKDLLGLDQLDALIDGLHDAGDVRRTKNLVPEFRIADDRQKRLDQEHKAAVARQRALTSAFATQRTAFATLLAALPSGAIPPTVDPAQLAPLHAALEAADDTALAVALSQRRRELAAIQNSLKSLPATPSGDERMAAEADEADAHRSVTAWRDTAGDVLEFVLNQLRWQFSDLPTSGAAGPKTAHEAATVRVDAEILRLRSILDRDAAAVKRVAEIEEGLERANARVTLVDDQIAGLASDADSLARALAEVTPHIHGDDCPVCGRDFSEESKGSLLAHVQHTISSLTEQADRLSGLARERTAATSTVATLQRDRDTERSKQVADDDRVAHQARLASLTSFQQQLINLTAPVAAGAAALQRLSEAQRRVASARDQDRLSTELREGAVVLCSQLGLPGFDASETLEAVLGRIAAFLAAEEDRLTAIREGRRQALSGCVTLLGTETDLATAAAEVGRLKTACQLAEANYEAADDRRIQAKAVGQAARDARTAIVRRVFNDSLNNLWRDLFVRLAPTEPFIPKFRLPETQDGVVAMLETEHRSGQRGGTPGAMLSSGNLNTAALTLFLALHLSIKSNLPWLVLDDPVQSMDEVHISQFAALLRTLSKAHGRKVMIAVHDRPLFDYLTLELSPTFAEDQLITVELSRSSNEASMAQPTFWPYVKDEVIAA